jgi:hypothetical protein
MFRQSRTVTNSGLAMALHWHLIDTTVNSSSVCSGKAHRQSDSRVHCDTHSTKTPQVPRNQHSRGSRRGSVPLSLADSRRQLFQKERFKKIEARSHRQLRAAQEQHKLSRPLISQISTQFRNVLIKRVGTKGQDQRSPRLVSSKKYEPSVATTRPEWRVVEWRSSWSARLSSSRRLFQKWRARVRFLGHLLILMTGSAAHQHSKKAPRA